MKKIIQILFAFWALSTVVYAQSIKIVRSDVDSARSGFITAGYIFGFDVYLDSVDRSNGVSFELQWNAPQFIKFSQWKIGNIGNRAQAFVMDKIDQTVGRIYAVIGTGLQLDSSFITNPKILRLEFVLLQNAPDGNQVTFKFVKPTATAILDSVAQVITLRSDDFVYKFHGMVDVYPGDADNNGTVDQSDFTQTLFYLGMGPLTKSVRTFKRQYASAYWTAQKCLRWDVAPATYADCDGNGEVNMDDLLIISFNLSKTRRPIQEKQIEKNHEILSNESENSNQIPLTITANRDFIAVALSLKIDADSYSNIKNILPSKIFGGNGYLHYNYKDNLLNIIVGSKDNRVITSKNERLDLLEFLSENNEIKYEIIEAKAINQFGEIFDLQNPTLTDIEIDVKQKSDKIVNILYQNHQLIVNLLGEYISSLSIVDLNGNTVKSYNYNDRTDNISLDLFDFAPQIYFVTIKTLSGKYFAEPIVLIR